jgi:hypothetical protein
MQRSARDVVPAVEEDQDRHLALATFLVCRKEEVIATKANLSPTVRVVGLWCKLHPASSSIPSVKLY